LGARNIGIEKTDVISVSTEYAVRIDIAQLVYELQLCVCVHVHACRGIIGALRQSNIQDGTWLVQEAVEEEWCRPGTKSLKRLLVGRNCSVEGTEALSVWPEHREPQTKAGMVGYAGPGESCQGLGALSWDSGICNH
jgi:hypothetical protein